MGGKAGRFKERKKKKGEGGDLSQKRGNGWRTKGKKGSPDRRDSREVEGIIN